MKKKRNFIIIGLLMIVFTFIWVNLNSSENMNPESKQGNQFHAEVKLSNLSGNIYQSIKLAQKRAQNFKKPHSFLKIFSSERIDSSLPLILELNYSDGVIERKITNIPDSFGGLTKGQLKLILKEWKLKKYDPTQALVLKKNIPQISPKNSNFYQIGVKEGKVAIFYGKKGKLLKQMTEIEVNELPQNEIRTLKEGIIVKNKEELLAILEGLRSIKED